MTRRTRLTHRAQGDIDRILLRSADEFGDTAADRYRSLIVAAIRDLAAEPDRPGSVARPELGDGVRSWHLRLSRGPAGLGLVRRPRHFVIYRVIGERIVIGRLLHDAMELERHASSDETWS